MKIPFYRFDAMHHPIRESLIEAVASVIDGGWYIMGDKLRQFESTWSTFSGVEHTVGVSNGLDALHIALKTLGIGPGDEVIIPSNTYIATALAVTYTGAIPVLAEPNPATFNLDPSNLMETITRKTKAIIPVHLYGQPCDMPAIMRVASEHQLFVIEDNAQAQGALIEGKKTGSWGHINATSFYPGKNLGALGDAGAITTNDLQFDQKARTWRNYGSTVKYYNEVRGFNARLDELQAAFLLEKIKHLDNWNQERSDIAQYYLDALASTGDLVLPDQIEGVRHVWHQFVIRTASRDALKAYLEVNGIGTLIHYPVPIHLQEAYRDMGWKTGQFPVSEYLATAVLSLPIFPGLRREEQDYIIDKIIRFFK